MNKKLTRNEFANLLQLIDNNMNPANKNFVSYEERFVIMGGQLEMYLLQTGTLIMRDMPIFKGQVIAERRRSERRK